MMISNPIDEIKRIRHTLGAEAGFDVRRIFAELREQQRTSSRKYVDTTDSTIADNKGMHTEPPSTSFPNGGSTSAAG
jgi:hypothetical protein